MTYQCATVLLYYFLFVVNKNLITVRFLFAHSESQLFLDIYNITHYNVSLVMVNSNTIILAHLLLFRLDLLPVTGAMRQLVG